MGIGLKIKAHLKNKGITAKSFSESIDENRTLVSDYLNENLKPSIKFLEKTIDFFPELDLNYLFREQEMGKVKEPVPNYEKSTDQLVEDIERKAGEIEAMSKELKKHLSQK